MQERGNSEQMKLLRQIRRHEAEMEIWCSQRSTASQDTPTKPSSDSDTDEINDETYSSNANELKKYQYIEPSTGARITDTSAISRIHAYCNQLPHDIYYKPAPIWEINEVSQANFICNLTLPSSAHIRHVSGEVIRSKRRAKQLVALRACIKLRELGGLDEHLLPIKLHNNKDELAEFDAALEDNKAFNGTTKIFPRKIPEVWLPKKLTEGGQWYMHTLVLPMDQSNEQYYRPMVIATRQPLPEGLDGIKLHLDKDTASLVRLIPWPRPIFLELDLLIRATEFMSALFHSTLRKEFVYKAASYLLFPMTDSVNPTIVESCNIQYIDWEQIINAKDAQRSSHPSLLKHLTSIDYAYERDMLVVDTSKYNQYYEVIDIRHDLPSIRNKLIEKLEYSVKNVNQPLLEVKWVKHRRFNYLNSVEQMSKDDLEKNPSTDGNYTLAETCKLLPLKASVFRMGALLPSFLYRMEIALLAIEYGKRFNLSTKLCQLSCAITLPSIYGENNYERLEMLGDSILKIMTSTSLYIEYPTDTEALLHLRRRNIICNQELCRNAVSRNIYAYMISKSFTRKQWTLYGFVVKTETSLKNSADNDNEEEEEELVVVEEELANLSIVDADEGEVFTIENSDGSTLELNDTRVAHYHEISEKMLADVIEASLGASLASFGEDAALQCAIKMGVPIMRSPSRWTEFKEFLPLPAIYPEDTIYPMNIKAIEAILGYTFKHPAYLVEAFTHGSAQAPMTRCYQRLEYLGDAVLDYLVVDLYYHRYPELDPGGISEIKDATVSNEFLGAICVLLGLHQHLDHFSDSLARDMNNYIDQLTKRRTDLKDKGEYWRGIKTPKIMGDLVESSLGAIYLDSGFDINEARKVFNRLLRPSIDDRIAPGKVNISPKCRFTKTVQKYGCNWFKFA
jgi:endoribonuclease Dicer